jgi:hypothetical protein
MRVTKRSSPSAAAARAAALACAVMLTAQTPAPAPQATNLPEIGRTRAKGFCTTVRDNVAPSVLGLMKTDDLIAAGHRGALKTADDLRATSSSSAASSAALDLDYAYLRAVAARMSHNLEVLKKLLADEKRFPKTPVTDDDKLALLLKAQLQAAIDRQTVALNHVSGLVETVAIGTTMKDVDTNMSGSVGGSAPASKTPSSGAPAVADQFLGAASLPGSGPGAMFQRSNVTPSNTPGQTIWNKLAADIEVQQKSIAAAEQTLTPTVVAAATACRDDGATPAPTRSP